MADNAFEEAVRRARKGCWVEHGSLRRLVYDVSQIPGAETIPRSLVVLLENVVRRASNDEEAIRNAERIVNAGLAGKQGGEIEFMPARVLFQDFTGVPVFVDFAAMRDAMVARGGDPTRVNPHIPCTLVVDHSVAADCTGTPDAAEKNRQIEAQRNHERFAFLKWASRSFDNVRIVPPGVGICHQLNVERFCDVVGKDALATSDAEVACFDTLVGTDSHTTTANGLGILGWGVGGIEAEAAALGQPITMLVPAVVGLHLTGELPAGTSGMDLALTVAQLLRSEGVVGCFVEVCGPGVAKLSATQRCCVANMTPEYGSTCTLFPTDEVALSYLSLVGRNADEIAFAQSFLAMQGVWGSGGNRHYARMIELDLSTVEPSLAGPSRPHDRLPISALRKQFRKAAKEHGYRSLDQTFAVTCGDTTYDLGHGTIAIAAVTSCTTATDPAMMVAAGLVAKKAVSYGLQAKPWVKRVLAPGSHATQELLEHAGLSDDLAHIGFVNCGYGCMSCIGNSGPILPCLKEHASDMELTSVLSGNRNFEGRISPDVAQNYLCQPALVVAYALVGTVDVDLSEQPVGISSDGTPVMLSDIMPTDDEIQAVLDEYLNPLLFSETSNGLLRGDKAWESIEVGEVGTSATFAWDENSTYVRRAPYFEIAHPQTELSVENARCLAFLGDFVTTDHISPAGTIALDSPAARYLEEHGVAPQDFNTYGSRRGNHEVMARGTFANVRLANQLVAPRLGGWTRDLLNGAEKSIFDAAEHYRCEKTPLVVVAGKMYGSGSSRDWAGKGPLLLGVRAVLAESFERIHRSNLIGMGILPLELPQGATATSLGLDGTETYSFGPVDLSAGLPASRTTVVTAEHADGTSIRFECVVRVDTPTEGAYLAAGGILPYVLSQLERA